MQALRGRVAPEFRHVSGSSGREIKAARHAITVHRRFPAAPRARARKANVRR